MACGAFYYSIKQPKLLFAFKQLYGMLIKASKNESQGRDAGKKSQSGDQ
jgi:hypothetical protein